MKILVIVSMLILGMFIMPWIIVPVSIGLFLGSLK